MKKLLLLSMFTISISALNAQLLKNIGEKIKNKSGQRADQKVDQTIDKGLDKTEEGAKDATKTKTEAKTETDVITRSGVQVSPGGNTTPTLKVYQNYDFVPGDKILFEDNFTDDQDGEFPSHWELKSGQAVINKLNGALAFHLIEGNYAVVVPRMKAEKYLSDPFTIEFDYYHVPGAYGIVTQLHYINKDCGDCESTADALVSESEASYGGPISLSKSYPEEMGGDNFNNKWHHVAMAFKNNQLKIYVDQSRILVVPDTKANFFSLSFAGIGDEKNPIIFKNVRVAAGGKMNMIGKKFTETRIVTHGINFDIDKATIRPESMGTLNMIVQVMKDNPELKFEVGGHTDNTGTATHNLTLSQQRAAAVRDQLIRMGVDASRLTSKGFGDTIPVGDNSTLEGRANNRRVEFVKS